MHAGTFREDGLTNTCILFDTWALTSSPESNLDTLSAVNQLRHSGSTVLSLDLNNDNVKDLILGDVSFRNLVALYNDNIGVNQNTSFISQDTAFPSNSLPVDLFIYLHHFMRTWIRRYKGSCCITKF